MGLLARVGANQFQLVARVCAHCIRAVCRPICKGKLPRIMSVQGPCYKICQGSPPLLQGVQVGGGLVGLMARVGAHQVKLVARVGAHCIGAVCRPIC